MSASLSWRPIGGGKSVNHEVKMALQDKYFSCPQFRFNRDNLPYLEGLKDAGLKGAKPLIEAIEKHDQIELFWES